MNKIKLYEQVSFAASTMVTKSYSTSFSSAIRLLHPAMRQPIYGIYGFVRLADEIVDSFDHVNQAEQLKKFEAMTYEALEQGFSIHPVLHSFQQVVHAYGISLDHIKAFFKSMEADLHVRDYNTYESYAEYIYGSAEVVGLMCLKVFCNGNMQQYNELLPFAQSLGAAFQKVNFLRDIKSDLEERGRFYFPNIDFNNFSENDKMEIIQEVKKDFDHAFIGIKKLPIGCRLGVYTAYIYYLKLLEKIERTTANEILQSRIRIPNSQKIVLLAKSYFQEKLMPTG